MKNHDAHYFRILSEIDAGKPVTQRALSVELGIALGLTNLLVKRLLRKGYIKMRAAIDGKRVKYLLTPSGIAEKARLSLVYLEHSIHLYAEARDRIRQSLDRIPVSKDGAARRRILFYGAGEIAEIAYVVLNYSAFELVGVVDDARKEDLFLGHRVGEVDQLAGDNGCPVYDHIVVTTFGNYQEIEMRLRQLSVPAEKICFL